MLEVLLLLIAAVAVLYLLGSLIAHKPKRARYKESPYAAGALLPVIRQRYESKIVFFALLFLVFDILAFMFVLSKGTLYPAIYLLIVLLAMLLVGKSVV